MDDLTEHTATAPVSLDLAEPSAWWRTAGASVTGTSHLDTGLPCQDAHQVRVTTCADGQPLLIAVVSDGAGSALHAEVASRAACAFAAARAEQLICIDGLTLDAMSPLQFVAEVRAHLEALATASDWPVRDLSCTLLIALVQPEAALFVQVGDGGIVFGTDQLEMALWSAGGEYANETHFVVSAKEEQVLSRLVHGSVKRVALLTDGLQMVALKLAEQKPHVPFFESFFHALQGAEDQGLFEAALMRTLDDARINARTDDDKTLVLAVLA